jgi:hypothetical protein
VAIDLNAQAWKARLMEARSTSTPRSIAGPAFQKVVEQVLASGVKASDVKKFLTERKDVFGDDAVQTAMRAGEALLDQTSPKRSVLKGTPAAGDTEAGKGVKAHAVRFAALPLDGLPSDGLPWFQRVALPQPPVLLTSKGDSVVVDGERFSAADVAALLRAA